MTSPIPNEELQAWLDWIERSSTPEPWLSAAIEAFPAVIRELQVARKALTEHEHELLEQSIARMGWPEIHAFRSEMSKGQSVYEDAGGYMMRGLRRLFGLPQIDEEVVTYQKAAKAMVARAALPPEAAKQDNK